MVDNESTNGKKTIVKPDGSTFIADNDKKHIDGYAGSTLARSKKPAIQRKAERDEIINITAKILNTPGFSIVAVGLTGAMVLMALGSQRPDEKLTNEFRDFTRQMTQMQQENNRATARLMAQQAEIVKRVTRPSVNVGLVQWGMRSNDPAVAPEQQQPQQPYVNPAVPTPVTAPQQTVNIQSVYQRAEAVRTWVPEMFAGWVTWCAQTRNGTGYTTAEQEICLAVDLVKTERGQ